MVKALFHISKMDCPSEEQMIRMKLSVLKNIELLKFDIPDRKLTVYHSGNSNVVLNLLEELKLGTSLISIEKIHTVPNEIKNEKLERKTLWAVLLINFGFFLIEITTGIISKSMGLIADSLDMLADSMVYGLALIAVGGSLILKKRVARFAGYLQIVLAATGFVEVVRRFLGFEAMPHFQTMIVVSVLALIANIVCLYLLQRNRSNEAHMKASMIFTSNDIIINAGIIIAALLVYWLQSGYPDLIIGAVVFVIVARGAYRILKLSKD
jgi:Co/Zn/Cd efflux system component